MDYVHSSVQITGLAHEHMAHVANAPLPASIQLMEVHAAATVVCGSWEGSVCDTLRVRAACTPCNSDSPTCESNSNAL